MYAAETRGSEIPEAEGKRGTASYSGKAVRRESSVVGQSRQFKRANLQKITLHPRKRLLFNIKPHGHAPPSRCNQSRRDETEKDVRLSVTAYGKRCCVQSEIEAAVDVQRD